MFHISNSLNVSSDNVFMANDIVNGSVVLAWKSYNYPFICLTYIYVEYINSYFVYYYVLKTQRANLDTIAVHIEVDVSIVTKSSTIVIEDNRHYFAKKCIIFKAHLKLYCSLRYLILCCLSLELLLKK